MSRVPTPEPVGRYKLMMRIGLVVLGIVVVTIGALRLAEVLSGANGQQAAPSSEPARQIDPKTCVDERGHVVLGALVELDGKQLLGILDNNGYRYEDGDGESGWVHADGSSRLMISVKDVGYLDAARLASLPRGGGVRPVTYELILRGYGSTASALDAMGNMDVEQRRDIAINASVLTLATDAGDRYLCRGSLDEDGVITLLLCNDAAISSGALVRYGTSIDAVYQNLISSKRGADELGLGDEGADLPEPPAGLTDECFDSHGNLTVYAVSELTGSELVQALESQGYEYDTSQKAFMTPAQNSRFAVLDANLSSLSKESIGVLDRGGGSMPVAYVLHTTDYRSAREMMDGLGKCTLLDRKVVNDHMTCAVMSGPSGRELLVSVSNPTDKGLLVMHVLSNEAVAAGMVDKMASENPKAPVAYGSSIAEVWQKLAGVPVGDYIREHPDE